MIHITKNGITILTIEEIKVIHVGQYKPYGNSFYEYDIITSEKDIEKIRKYCIENITITKSCLLKKNLEIINIDSLMQATISMVITFLHLLKVDINL